jgi:Bacterial extracellular solute-binding proteins, family 3
VFLEFVPRTQFETVLRNRPFSPELWQPEPLARKSCPSASPHQPGDALSVEPYGIMLRRDDAAFKKVVDEAMIATYRSGAINPIYDKWFLNVPMSDAFKKVVASPTDSGDPAVY